MDKEQVKAIENWYQNTWNWVKKLERETIDPQRVLNIEAIKVELEEARHELFLGRWEIL